VWQAGQYSNVANSHQVITMDAANGVWKSYPTLGTGVVYVSLQIRAGTVDHVILSTNDGTSWTDVSATKIIGLDSTWQLHVWEFIIPGNGNVNFHIGVVPPSPYVHTQTAGTIEIKNISLYKLDTTSTVASRLTCNENIYCDRSVSASSFISTSDISIKENVDDATLESCKALFDNVDVKTYNRTDMPGKRLGYIAQDIQQHLAPEFANIISTHYSTTDPLLAVDYSRMICVLWKIVKDQEARLSLLEAKNQP
jgi:hypothetical protein